MEHDAGAGAPAWGRRGAGLLASDDWRLGLAAVFVIWALAAAQWSLNDLVVPWDSKNQFYAFFRFMADAIHQGGTPFWNPYHYAGHPSVADPQSLIFQPPFLLWALFDPTPSMAAFDLIVYAHLLVGGLALVFYGRRHGWPVAAGVLAAAIFMFAGPAASRLSHVGIITTYGLVPLALLLIEIALDRRSFPAAVGFGATFALIALGRSQAPLMFCVMIAALAVGHLWRQPAPARFLVSRLPVLFAAGATLLLLVAAPMLLTLQFAAFSNRPSIELDVALKSSLYPVNLANFFVANVFGSLEPSAIGDWGPSGGTRPGVDWTDRAFNYLFAGSLAAILLVWRGGLLGGAWRPGRRLLTLIAATAMLYACGRYAPLFGFSFEHIPGVSLFRRPVDATFVFVIALALLVGHLAADYVGDAAKPAPRLPALLTFVAVAALLAWAVAFSAGAGKAAAALAEIGKTLPIYAGLIAILLWPRAPAQRRVALALAVCVGAAELVARNVAASFNAEPREGYALLEKPTGEAAHIFDVLRRDMEAHGGASERARVEIAGLGGPWQNAAMSQRLEAANGYNPLRIGPYDRLVSPGESPYLIAHRSFPESFPRYDCRLAKLLGLKYVVLDRPLDQLPSMRIHEGAVALLEGPKAWVYRLPKVSPRAQLESRVRVADAESMIDAGSFPAGQAGAEVLVDADDTLSRDYRAIAAARPGHVDIVAWRPDRVELVVDAAAPQVLTLRDPWYPGWEVTVDGEPRPLLRTDLLFRGVEAPAGRHRIVFSYRPFSFANLRAAAELLWEGE